MLDVYEKLPVCHNLNDGKIRSCDVIIDNQLKFSTLLLQPKIHDGLSKCGYVYLSPIQQSALPLTLAGSSVIAHAKSGTGKTLIYVLTVLNEFIQRKSKHFLCLVLAPTREIAKQIYDVFRNVACYIEGIQIEFFIGGTPLDIDVLKCMSCHIAVGAPGRIKHLIDLGYLKTDNLQLLVLDEVDALFDHKEFEILNIISLLPPLKQLIVCTATFSSKIGSVLKSIVPDIKYTSTEKLENEEIRSTSNMLIGIKQYVATVEKSMDAMRKREKLVEILQNFNFEQCFIFVNYISLVKSICNLLLSNNFSALWISSEQNQSSRINILNKIKMNHCKILVTTDLAARGIDVHNVNLVINLGLPTPPDVYIHRMGRAGRYGSEGAVITILSEGEEMNTFTKLISMISTDPVILHMLPKEIGSDLSNLKTVHCLPSHDSVSVDEFFFKRNMKDKYNRSHEHCGNQNKKSKKKKPKIQKKIHEFTPADKLSYDDGPITASRHEKAITCEEVSNKLKDFKKSLLSSLSEGESELESSSVEHLFHSRNFDTDADVKEVFVTKPPECLLSYAVHVKQNNKLMDQQIIPCSIEEFLSTLDYDNDRSGHYSFSFWNLIREVSLKSSPIISFTDSSSTESIDSENFPEKLSVQVPGPSLSNQLFETMTKNEDKRYSHNGVEVQSSLDRVSKNFSLSDQFSSVMMISSNKARSQNAVEKIYSKVSSHVQPSDQALRTESIQPYENPSSNIMEKSENSPKEVAKVVIFSNKFQKSASDISPRRTSNAANKAQTIPPIRVSQKPNQVPEKRNDIFGGKTSFCVADKTKKPSSKKVSEIRSLSEQFLHSFDDYSTKKDHQKTNSDFGRSREEFSNSCNELNSVVLDEEKTRNVRDELDTSFEDAHNKSSFSDQILGSERFVDEKSVEKTSVKSNSVKQRGRVFRNSQPNTVSISTNYDVRKNSGGDGNSSERTTRQFPSNFLEIGFKNRRSRRRVYNEKHRKTTSKQARVKLDTTDEPTDAMNTKKTSRRNPRRRSFSSQSTRKVDNENTHWNSSEVLENSDKVPFSTKFSFTSDGNLSTFPQRFQNSPLLNQLSDVTGKKCSDQMINERNSSPKLSDEKKPTKRKSSDTLEYSKEALVSSQYSSFSNNDTCEKTSCTENPEFRDSFSILKNFAKTTVEGNRLNESRVPSVSNANRLERDAVGIKSPTLLNSIDDVRREKTVIDEFMEHSWETSPEYIKELFDINLLKSWSTGLENRVGKSTNGVNPFKLSDRLKKVIPLSEHNSSDTANKNNSEFQVDDESRPELWTKFGKKSLKKNTASDQGMPNATERLKKPALAKYFSGSKSEICPKRKTNEKNLSEVQNVIIDEPRLGEMARKMESSIKPADVSLASGSKNYVKLSNDVRTSAEKMAAKDVSSKVLQPSSSSSAEFSNVPQNKSLNRAHADEKNMSKRSHNVPLSKQFFNAMNENQFNDVVPTSRFSMSVGLAKKVVTSDNVLGKTQNVTDQNLSSISASRANQKTGARSPSPSGIRNTAEKEIYSHRGQTKCKTLNNDTNRKNISACVSDFSTASTSKMNKSEKNYPNTIPVDCFSSSNKGATTVHSGNGQNTTSATAPDNAAPVDFENDSDFQQGDEIAVTLPSLRSFVSSYRENEIWQNHFSFINRSVISRFRLNSTRRF